ncbi:mucin-3A-like [Patiria miniata]|uniref:Uncharacterized protein n=1 Tax=Patiria miniata TaxID=46514 RepID=A0A913ZGY3_PATMI|nr:mucin-3A-like [Patiria miniata]
MNSSVLCLFLLVAGATTLALATTPAHTTGNKATTKATVHTTTERPKTTHSQPTTARKTTHSQPTTALKTTHSHPTPAPKTTHSQPTTAPKTTHSHPTTAPKTTHTRPTTAQKTTANHTPGKTTKTPTHTTAASANTTSNATGSTVGPKTPELTTVPGPENVIPTYQLKNGSEVCMLFVFNATLTIKYETTNNQTGVATIPIGGNINGTDTEWTLNSICRGDAFRYFQLSAGYAVPNSIATGYASLGFKFDMIHPDKPFYSLWILNATWSYFEPFFPRDVKNYGKEVWAANASVYAGTMGKTFGCQTLKVKLTSNPKLDVSIILDHVMLQPYADHANGTFGDVEECTKPNPTTMEPTTANATMATTAFPHPPTKPSPNNGGMIAGIVIGVLAFVVLIIGIAVFVVRKRRMKEAAYGHLDEEHKDYVH